MQRGRIFAFILFLTLGLINASYLLGASAMANAVSAQISGPISPTPTPKTKDVTIVSPTAGQVVLGAITISVSAFDNVSGVNRVVIQINGVSICTDYSNPYSCVWNVPATSGVTYTITAWAIDNAGNKNSTSIVVTSNGSGLPTPTPKPAGDKTPPAVAITAPTNGATVSGTLTIAANAQDAQSGINRVVIQVNGSSICTDSNAPYSCNWTVPAGSGVSYTLTAWAIDNAGNKKSSSVKVSAQ